MEGQASNHTGSYSCRPLPFALQRCPQLSRPHFGRAGWRTLRTGSALWLSDTGIQLSLSYLRDVPTVICDFALDPKDIGTTGLWQRSPGIRGKINVLY